MDVVMGFAQVTLNEVKCAFHKVAGHTVHVRPPLVTDPEKDLMPTRRSGGLTKPHAAWLQL